MSNHWTYCISISDFFLSECKAVKTSWGEGNGEGQEGEESGGKWGNWESYGRVKQLAQRFLTAQRCVLMPPAQRPRSEVRRNRGTEAWESDRKCPKVGKFSKLNRETSHQQAGWLNWLFGGHGEGEIQTDWQREIKTEVKMAQSKAYLVEMIMVIGLGKWEAIIYLPTNPLVKPLTDHHSSTDLNHSREEYVFARNQRYHCSTFLELDTKSTCVWCDGSAGGFFFLNRKVLNWISTEEQPQWDILSIAINNG